MNLFLVGWNVLQTKRSKDFGVVERKVIEKSLLMKSRKRDKEITIRRLSAIDRF